MYPRPGIVLWSATPAAMTRGTEPHIQVVMTAVGILFLQHLKEGNTINGTTVQQEQTVTGSSLMQEVIELEDSIIRPADTMQHTLPVHEHLLSSKTTTFLILVLVSSLLGTTQQGRRKTPTADVRDLSVSWDYKTLDHPQQRADETCHRLLHLLLLHDSRIDMTDSVFVRRLKQTWIVEVTSHHVDNRPECQSCTRGEMRTILRPGMISTYKTSTSSRDASIV